MTALGTGFSRTSFNSILLASKDRTWSNNATREKTIKLSLKLAIILDNEFIFQRLLWNLTRKWSIYSGIAWDERKLRLVYKNFIWRPFSGFLSLHYCFSICLSVIFCLAKDPGRLRLALKMMWWDIWWIG